MHRSAVYCRVTGGDPHSVGYLGGRDGAHGDDHWAGEHPGRVGGDVRAIHGHVLALGDVLHRHVVIQQRGLEGKGAADDEADEIIAPYVAHVRNLAVQLAVAVHAVQRNVAADVPVRQQLGGNLSGFQHAEQRARLRVALGEQQEVECLLLGQGDQVRLCITPRVARGVGHGAAAEDLTRLLWRERARVLLVLLPHNSLSCNVV